MESITIGNKFEGKYSFRETCFGIVVKENKILLVKKDEQYSLVGGGVEDSETFKECLEREFLEESGYSITGIEELVSIDCYWLAANKYPMLSRTHIFKVEIDTYNKKDALEDGCYIEWVDIDRSIELLALPYHKKAIEYYISK